MLILPFECGPLATNCYFLADEDSKEALLIDCPPGIEIELNRNGALVGYNLKVAVITHGHWDHTADAIKLQRILKIPIAIHKNDKIFMENPFWAVGEAPMGVKGCTADMFVSEGNILTLGDLHFSIIDVPGHSPGHIAVYHPESRSLFCGDVLFRGSIGRTDFRDGDYDMLMDSIMTKLMVLPDDTTVYPGHGASTTIGLEKRTNPFVLDYLEHFGD